MSDTSGETDIPRYRVKRLQDQNRSRPSSNSGQGNIRSSNVQTTTTRNPQNTNASQKPLADDRTARPQNPNTELYRQKPQYKNRRYGGSKNNGQGPILDPEEQERIQKRRERFSKEDEQQKRERDAQYGFVSRGEDTRLQQSEKSRHDFFNQILLSFVEYCSENTASSLHRDLSKFIDRKDELVVVEKAARSPLNKTRSEGSPSRSTSMDAILTSLRKLREAMINSKADGFAKKVFLFSIRISANIGHYQTYIPSINYLLSPANVALLDPLEKEEIATLLILHIAHFNQQYNIALRLFFKYLQPDTHSKVFRILQSFISRNYYQWVQMYNSEVDNAVFNTMKFGLATMLESMIACITASYFRLSMKELEGTMLPSGITFDIVTTQYGAKWTRHDDEVTIRERLTRNSK